MKSSRIERLTVNLDIEGTKIEFGKLAWSKGERLAYFQFSPEFLQKQIPISPFFLKPTAAPISAKVSPFDGLHGVFNDSLPDGWGRLLLDRRLAKAGIDYTSLTPLDRLAAIGARGTGALSYVSEMKDETDHHHDLDWFVEQAENVQNDLDVAELDKLQAAQGGLAGARPKLMIGMTQTRDKYHLDFGQDLPPGYERWLVKAKSKDDHPEIGAEEHAYALMARKAGLTVAETMVIATEKGHRLFATKRFDRTVNGRLHMHTASGLVYASHREPALSYEQLLKLTRALTRNEPDVEAMFRRMVFNVLSHNRDDHAKNHAFLMDGKGSWRIAPSYDLTFSSGPGGEHSATIAGEGKQPGFSHLMRVAAEANISKADAANCIDEVHSAIAMWPKWADMAGLSRKRTQEISKYINDDRNAPKASLANGPSPN